MATKAKVSASKRKSVRAAVRKECKTYNIRPIDLSEQTGVSSAACCKLISGKTKDIRSDIAELLQLWLDEREALKDKGEIPRLSGQQTEEVLSPLTVAENIKLKDQVKQLELQIFDMGKAKQEPDQPSPPVVEELPVPRTAGDTREVKQIATRMRMYGAMLANSDDKLMEAAADDLFGMAIRLEGLA